jgi:hypothetical protein
MDIGGKCFLCAPLALSWRGQAAAKKVIIHAETRRRGVRGDVFCYKLFYSASLRLRVKKNILPDNGRISRVNESRGQANIK